MIRPHVLWPALIVALIGLNVSIVAATVYFAVTDRSVGVEPDYYGKALRYGQALEQKRMNEDLGWVTTAEFRPSQGTSSVELTVALSDRTGAPIDGASVSAEAFANARSARSRTSRGSFPAARMRLISR